MATISIIVPVYNVSRYIERCLLSLIRQTYRDIEIIIVDDCGTDDSIRKAEQLAATDSRLKIIHNTCNQGLAEARNIGMEAVTTEYIAFLDSDDWVAPDFYDKLYRNIVHYQADIAVGNVLYYRKEHYSLTHEWVSLWNFKLDKKVAVTPEEKQYNIYACACWNKLYRTSLFKDNKLLFPKNLLIEDVPITVLTTILANKLVMVDDAILYYRQREDSIMGRAVQNKAPFDIFKIYEYTDTLLKGFKHIPQLQEYWKILDNYKIFNIYGWYNTLRNDDSAPEYYSLMKRIFSSINIKKNPYISEESLKYYNEVLVHGKLLKKTRHRLFGILSTVKISHFQAYTKITLFNHILLDKIVHSDNNARHYLFGLIPFLTVRYR